MGSRLAQRLKISRAASNEKLGLGNIDVARAAGWVPESMEPLWRMLQLPKA